MNFRPGRIYQHDCVDGLRQLPAGSVDLVFADPPFNIGYEYDVYDDRQEAEAYLGWSRQWIAGVFDVLKPTGTFWLAIGDEFAAELKLLSQDIGFHCRSWVVWYYTFGVNCKRKFSRSHAHLFHFVKDPTTFTFNDTEIRVPSARQLVYADGRANPAGRLPDDTWFLRPQDLVDGLSADEDVWYFPRVAGTFKERAGFHGCQMPEQLPGRIIRVSSNPGELVLDPFTGSATTLTVAKKLGREWIGFEISDEYVSRGRARVEAACVGDPLEGAPEPRVSAPPTHGPAQTKGKTKRPETTQTATAPPLKRVKSDVERCLIEAFTRTSEGYSVDRTVVDPERNAAFIEECRRLGVPGTPADMNRMLFRLRKAGRLLHVPTLRRTEFDWRACDGYLFASEIALRQMLDQGWSSLDEVLCSPALATEFDRIAADFAPGHTSLQYRWAALKLRKGARLFRHRSQRIGRQRAPVLKSLSGLRPERVEQAPGVYLLTDGPNRVLYAGSAFDLRSRLIHHGEQLDRIWMRYGNDLRVGFLALPDVNPDVSVSPLFACQSRLILEHHPRFNYSPTTDR